MIATLSTLGWALAFWAMWKWHKSELALYQAVMAESHQRRRALMLKAGLGRAVDRLKGRKELGGKA